MKKVKKVLAVTGIRSEYDILYPVLKAINENENFQLQLAVSSAHLSDWHGFTLKSIEADGFEIVDKIDCLLMTNRKTQRSKGVGLLTYALSQTVERVQPDILLVLGDREESIATAIVGNYMDVLVAHIGGGDPVYGNADDPIRIAVSKIAHLHFTLAKPYAENLLRISEQDFRIHFAGNPAYYNIDKTPYMDIATLSNSLNFDLEDQKFLVLIKHPLSSELKDSYQQMKVTLKALEEFCIKYDFKLVSSYPNTDPGSYDILRAVKEFENKDFVTFTKSLPRVEFVNLMRHARALCGNSSMGILEAPHYKLPVVNIGSRQTGRLNAGNVKFVEHDEAEIIGALEQACFDEAYRDMVRNIDNPYGDGTAAEKILDVLIGVDTKDPKWLVKSDLC